MKERPILFSGEMVHAILEGRKTQTRRVIKPTAQDKWLFDGGWSDEYIKNPGNYMVEHCPYGVPGDRLWVRETWGVHRLAGENGALEFPNILYKADSSTRLYISDVVWDYQKEIFEWHPSIHMPRWASRITLEIVNVRVERVQDISLEDTLAEGIIEPTASEIIAAESYHLNSFVYKYACLWDAIYGRRSWDVNPYVWALTFRRIE